MSRCSADSDEDRDYTRGGARRACRPRRSGGLRRRGDARGAARACSSRHGRDDRSRAWPTRAFLSLADALVRYHRHRVVNLDRLRRLFRSGRRVLLVGNHALDIADPLLLLATVFRKLHRAPRFIGHENGWFRVPVLRDISARFNIIPSRRPELAVAALRRTGFSCCTRARFARPVCAATATSRTG